MKNKCASSWLFTEIASIIKENLENIFKTSATNVNFDYKKNYCRQEVQNFWLVTGYIKEYSVSAII